MNTLKKHREKCDFTQEELANLVGISVRTLQDYEQSRKPLQGVRAIAVLNMARVLGCTVEDLIDPKEGSQGATADKLTDQELADLFSYCSRLARMVSPADAARYFRFTFDGTVGDTLGGLAMLYANELSSEPDGNTATAFKRDELYGPTLRQMMDDIRAVLDGRVSLG